MYSVQGQIFSFPIKLTYQANNIYRIYTILKEHARLTIWFKTEAKNVQDAKYICKKI